ncbi:MAG: hypothetical protein ACRD5H_13435 [Nitrososphaerales archaeon]
MTLPAPEQTDKAILLAELDREIDGVKQRLLTMSPEERKNLGINKSTLWYQRKTIAEGKRIRVHGKLLSKLI